MKRRAFLLSAITAAVFAAPAFAETVVDQVARQLRGQGYSSITVGKTWLGRTRIVATDKNRQREIILNPRTGEILRDFWQTTAKGGSGNGQIIRSDDDNSGSGSSGSGSDDDDDDDSSGSSGSGGNSGPGGGDSDDDRDDDRDDERDDD